MKGRLPKTSDVKVEDRNELLAAAEDFMQWYAKRRTHALDGVDLTPEEYRFLGKLIEGSGTILGEQSRQLKLSEGHGGRVLGRLQQKGWVRIERGAKDRRQKTVQVTPQGEQMLALGKQQLEHLLERLLGKLGKPQRRRLLEAVQTLNRLGRTWGQLEILDLESVSGRKLQLPELDGKPRGKKTRMRRKSKGQAWLSGTALVEVDTPTEWKANE
jgi:DNA-binding MarR family transcriptional regulator